MLISPLTTSLYLTIQSTTAAECIAKGADGYIRTGRAHPDYSWVSRCKWLVAINVLLHISSHTHLHTASSHTPPHSISTHTSTQHLHTHLHTASPHYMYLPPPPPPTPPQKAQEFAVKSTHQSVQKAVNEFNSISENILEKLQEFPEPPRGGASPGYLVSCIEEPHRCK